MDDPVSSLIGVMLIAFGITMVYGAYKNRKVLGSKGIIPTALATGSLVSIDEIPEAYPSFSIDPTLPGAGVVEGAKTLLEKMGKTAKEYWEDLTGTSTETSKWRHPDDVVEAVARIEQVDTITAKRIASELDKISPTSSLTLLGLLLKVADNNGRKSDAEIIRAYVKKSRPDATI